MELRVSFRGKALVVQGVGGATLIADLKEKLADLTAVPTDNLKLVSYVHTYLRTYLRYDAFFIRTSAGTSCKLNSAATSGVYLKYLPCTYALCCGHGTCLYIQVLGTRHIGRILTQLCPSYYSGPFFSKDFV